MALGMLERLQRLGVAVVYITPTLAMAKHFKRITTVPILSFSQALKRFPAEARAAAVDEVGHMPWPAEGVWAEIKRNLERHPGLTELLLVETIEQP